MSYDYDVIIVGSGVAGALCAWKLSTLGKYRILILEAGDNGIGEGQRVEFHHAMDRRGGRGDMFAPYMELKSRALIPSPENAAKPPKQKADEKYYDYTPESEDTFRAGYNRMVGGSTWSWRGNCPRFLPTDFKLESTYGVGKDWPITYDEIEPHYCEAEHELGVSGNHDELKDLFGAHRSKPFPMAGIPLTYSDKQVHAKIHGKTVDGVEIRVVTTPQARNSAPFDGRPACEGHSNCIPLCPIHAKYDATVHLRRIAQHAGDRVTLQTHAAVTRVSPDDEGRITKVHYIDWRVDKAKERVVSAPIVVLAAHAIETPKLLLQSGVANSSDQVGRNLMDHIQWEVAAEFPEPVYPFRGPQSVVSIEAFREGTFRKERSAFRMTIGNDGWGRAGSPARVVDELLVKQKAYGPKLMDLVAERVSRMIRLSFSTEQLPDPDNRVQLSTNLDPLGLPRPLITFKVGKYSTGGLQAGVAAARKLFEEMGAKYEQKELIENGVLNWNTAAHIMGTCRMGDKKDDSVVDALGRSHDHENLFIIGSSVFATGATANPTLTLAALTLRSAVAIHKQFRGQA